jgi:hypothetical protein
VLDFCPILHRFVDAVEKGLHLLEDVLE